MIGAKAAGNRIRLKNAAPVVRRVIGGIMAVCMGMEIYVYVRLRVDISMTVMGDASIVMRYDRRTRDLFNAPLRMKQDTTSIEKWP